MDDLPVDFLNLHFREAGIQIECVLDASKGRKVIACRDYHPGEVILKNEALGIVLYEESRKSWCYYCLKRDEEIDHLRKN
jgi:hypothetical protein